MAGILNTYLWGCGLAASLTALGFALGRTHIITVRNSKRYTVLLSSLAAASVLWVFENSGVKLERTVFDLLILFAVLWFLCYFLFWAGLVFGIKKLSRKRGHRHDFAESSILSMQFLDSRIHDSQHAKDSQFKTTEVASATASAPLTSETETTASQGKKAVRIPVTRHND